MGANYNPLCVLLQEISFRNFETKMYVPKFPKVYDGSQKLSKLKKSLYLLDSPPISNSFTFTQTGLAYCSLQVFKNYVPLMRKGLYS